MQIGVPKEIKDQEYRVGMTPSSVKEVLAKGHKVMVQHHAGLGIGFTDEHYRRAGAEIVDSAVDIYKAAELIVKVKEPQPEEIKALREGQILFTFLHLAPDPKQAELLLASGCIAIAYETITDDQGGLPILTPMSEVAGRLSVPAGAHCLLKAQGGRGVLMGGVPGVPPAEVVILGAGVVGTQALRLAIGMGASVRVIDKSLKRLRELDLLFGNQIITSYANADVESYIRKADLVIGAVLVPGAAAPKLVTRQLLREMQPGSVIVDVSIDQGGCFESSRPTTHSNPTYVEEGIVHYCVSNMPGGVPYTSTIALNNATLPFILSLADKGYRRAGLENPHLLNGLNICAGKVTHRAVAMALNTPYTPAEVELSSKTEIFSLIHN